MALWVARSFCDAVHIREPFEKRLVQHLQKLRLSGGVVKLRERNCRIPGHVALAIGERHSKLRDRFIVAQCAQSVDRHLPHAGIAIPDQLEDRIEGPRVANRAECPHRIQPRARLVVAECSDERRNRGRDRRDAPGTEQDSAAL